MEALTIGISRGQLAHFGGRMVRGVVRMPDNSIGISCSGSWGMVRGMTCSGIRLLPGVVLTTAMREALAPALMSSGGVIVDSDGAQLWPQAMADLIERSSFGTPEARALRATVSDEHAARIVARADELAAESPAPQVQEWRRCTSCGYPADGLVAGVCGACRG